MSKEEKMLILQMVADGQITPEQGVELLQALEPGKARGPSGQFDGVDIGGVVRRRVEEAAVRGEDVAESVASNIGRMISQIFAGGYMGGSEFKFTEEIRGMFPEEGELQVHLSTSNGRIAVETWDEPGYLLTITKGIRGRDEDEARQALENCYEFRQEGLTLEASTSDRAGRGMRGLSVAFALKVPASRKTSVNLSSANGRITKDGVTANTCTLSTANCRKVVTRCEFDKARLSTANGRVEYDGRAGDLDASTANGAINAEMKGAGDWQFSSGNGRIEINVSKDANAAYEVDLCARSSGITVEGMDDAEVVEDVVRGRRRRRYRARSRGFESAGVKGRIRATTGNGKLRVWF